MTERLLDGGVVRRDTCYVGQWYISGVRFEAHVQATPQARFSRCIFLYGPPEGGAVIDNSCLVLGSPREAGPYERQPARWWTRVWRRIMR